MPIFYQIIKPEVEATKLTEKTILEVYSFVYGKPDLSDRIANDKWDMYEDIVKRDGMQIRTFLNTFSTGIINDTVGCVARIGDYVIKHPTIGFVAMEERLFKMLFSISYAKE